jgi:hypothetical protein
MRGVAMPPSPGRLGQTGFHRSTEGAFLKQTFIASALCALALCAALPAHASKRGFGGEALDRPDLVAASKFDWYYNWGQQPSTTFTGNVEDYAEYVPMAWGANYDQQALINYLSAHPRVKFILGFNEPNFKSQANLTPSQAAAAWPQLEAIADRFKLTIVGPALNFSYAGGAVVENGVEYTDPVKWYDDFFAACKNCRVDHIAIHGYFDNAAVLPWYIGLFAKYNKPIWVTEFNQSPSSSMAAQMQFMRDAIPILEKDPRVFRYAWFLARSSQADTNLFATQPGVLTDLGKLYASLPADDVTGQMGPEGYTYAAREGAAVRIDGAMDIAYGAYGSFRYLNGVTQDRNCDTGTFGADPAFGAAKNCYVRYTPTTQTAQTIRAAKYVVASGVQLQNTADTGGGQEVGWIDAGDWMRYAPLTIYSGGNYTFTFRTASATSGQQLALVNAVTGKTLGTVSLPNTGASYYFGNATTTVSLPAGVYQFKVVAVTSGFNVNAFSYKRMN